MSAAVSTITVSVPYIKREECALKSYLVALFN
jgi:hypothetical protein